MMMCIVSPVALGPTMRSTDLMRALKGALLLYVLSGISPSSSLSGTDFLAIVDVAAALVTTTGRTTRRVAALWPPNC